MTMPIERTLSILNTRKYLADKLASDSTSANEKNEIRGLLRHFPDASGLRSAALANASLFSYDQDDLFNGRRLRQAIEDNRKIRS